MLKLLFMYVTLEFKTACTELLRLILLWMQMCTFSTLSHNVHALLGEGLESSPECYIHKYLQNVSIIDEPELEVLV